ncbi:hypothetical protein APSETT445_004824 [Aspergillus pseudonomiae]
MLDNKKGKASKAYDGDRTNPYWSVFEEKEVFKKTDIGVNFRQVGWFNAGNFRTKHPYCHSIADMAEVVGGIVAKEATGLLYIIAYVLATGSGIVGVSTALNALSHHAACTVWWSFLATVVIIVTASMRKLQHVGWLTYAGFISIYAAVLIVVIGVTTRDRPAAAPQEGPYELGFVAINNPGFAAGMVASCTIFVSSAGTSAFLPVISEMRNSRHLQANTVVHWGTWIASTVILGALSFILAEAIPIFNYLIALIGSVCFAPLAMSLPGWLWLYDHWHYKNGTVKHKAVFILHCGLVLLGLLFLVGATYGVIIQIIDAYSSGAIAVQITQIRPEM